MSIGYADYCELRSKDENLKKSDLEKDQNPRWCIYFGRSHVIDFETGILARGPLKVGKAKYANTLIRGRSQDGSNFRLYAEIVLESETALLDADKIIKTYFLDWNIPGEENQTELYNIKDSEIPNFIKFASELILNKTGHNITRINDFTNKSSINIPISTTNVSTFGTLFS